MRSQPRRRNERTVDRPRGRDYFAVTLALITGNRAPTERCGASEQTMSRFLWLFGCHIVESYCGGPRQDYMGVCGQCGRALYESEVKSYEEAWDDVRASNPTAPYLDCVASTYPCGHIFIVRKSLWKTPNGFVYSVGLPGEFKSATERQRVMRP